jgi:chain length determinant protein (polysaccharide antigen chain regulator)
VYRSSIYFYPPHDKNIAMLNSVGLEKRYAADQVYLEFQRNFMARDNLWSFFVNQKLYSVYSDSADIDDVTLGELFDEEFVKAIRLDPRGSKRTDPDLVKGTLDWLEPVGGAELLNRYARQIKKITEQQIIEEVQSLLRLKMKRLVEEIEALRSSAESVKQSRMLVLEENIAIARRLGLKRAMDLQAGADRAIIVGTSSEKPLYFLGYEVLEAEKDVLLSREDNDPFIPELEALLKQKDQLSNIQLKADELQAVRITQDARPKLDPVKPRRALMVLFGGVFGGVLGILAVFVARSVARSE